MKQQFVLTLQQLDLLKIIQQHDKDRDITQYQINSVLGTSEYIEGRSFPVVEIKWEYAENQAKT